MYQSEYKCKADKSFGPHSGPENYEAMIYSDGNWFPICEKHAKNAPYNSKYDTSKAFTVRPKNVDHTIHCVYAGDSSPHSAIENVLIWGYWEHKFQWVPICENHLKHYDFSSWTMEFLDKTDKIEKIPDTVVKYQDAMKHYTIEGTHYYCSDGNFDGMDGSKLHFGKRVWWMVRGGFPEKFCCDNHAIILINQGYRPIRYGYQNSYYECTSADFDNYMQNNYPSYKGAPMITRGKVAGGWTIRTQKAKGIMALRKAYFDMPKFEIYDVQGIEPSTLLGKFVRPCPMRPRHGFVDSRKIDNEEQAAIIVRETLEADPDAEFVVMPYINAPYSGIWTTGHLAIGLGTDGATSGKTAVTIPVIGTPLKNSGYGTNIKEIQENAGIKDTPYIELLWETIYEETVLKFVQLRDGPKIPGGAIDYVPAKMIVGNVIPAAGDLLEWETTMKHVPPGTVVDHVGGSLASHYAIHAVLNNVPILISKHPKVGETLEPTEDKAYPIDIQALRAGFTLAQSMKLSYQEACYVMLAGCHHIVAWSGKQDLLLGFAMGCAWRLTLIASLGEVRHHRKGSSRRREIKSRDTVYDKAWEKTDEQYTRKRFANAIDAFLNGCNWPGPKFGGKSWFKFAANAVYMYNALINKEPSKALEALNRLVHSAHNTGWGFNKFIENSELDKTAANPVYACLKIAPMLYKTLVTDEESLKSAARSFWKRDEITLPEDKGTGGMFDPDDEDDIEDKIMEGCTCAVCTDLKAEVEKKHKEKEEMKEPHLVKYAQAKLIDNGIFPETHVQWTSDKMHGKSHFTKNIPYNEKINSDMFYGVTVPSLTQSFTQYIPLVKYDDGWYLQSPEHVNSDGDTIPFQDIKLLENMEIPVVK